MERNFLQRPTSKCYTCHCKISHPVIRQVTVWALKAGPRKRVEYERKTRTQTGMSIGTHFILSL